MDTREQIQRLRDEYEAALDVAEARRAAYHAAIRRLYLAGKSLQEIADQLGVSRQRVHQIVGDVSPARKRRGGRVAGAVLLAIGLAGGLTLGMTWKVLGHQAELFSRPAPPGPADPELRACPRHPCSGWRYGLVYRKADGFIISSGGSSPAQGTPETPVVLGEVEDRLDLTGHPQVPTLISDRGGAYYVDVATGEIRPRRDARLLALVAVSVLTNAGGAGLVVQRRDGRRRSGVVPAT